MAQKEMPNARIPSKEEGVSQKTATEEARIPFRPEDPGSNQWVKDSGELHINCEEGMVLGQHQIHQKLGDFFNEMGFFPKKITMDPDQFLNLRAALGLYGDVKEYRYMEFSFEPKKKIEVQNEVDESYLSGNATSTDTSTTPGHGYQGKDGE